MAEVTTSLVKALREKTNAGMMDCKRALVETGADLEAAVDWLRKKGLAAAAKRSGRTASDGLVGIAVASTEAAIVEINSETDFVARNAKFQDLVLVVSKLALQAKGEATALMSLPLPGGARPLSEEITEIAATIGENITFRRCDYVSVGQGLVASYVHSALAPGIGRIGVLVALSSTRTDEPIQDLGKKIAMHVAAANPLAISKDSLSSDALERERQVLMDQARASGKPEAVLTKMVEGRLNKYYEDVCLLEQPFVMDPQTKVGALLAASAKELGTEIKVERFVRFALGEGLERQQEPEAA